VAGLELDIIDEQLAILTKGKAPSQGVPSLLSDCLLSCYAFSSSAVLDGNRTPATVPRSSLNPSVVLGCE
jgi:hypothetical protein